MYSSFISVKSDTSGQVNQKYIKSLEDQIKIREEQRLQLLKRLQKFQNNTKDHLNQNINPDLQTENEKTENESLKQEHHNLKKKFQEIQNQKNILKQANTQIISSLMFDYKHRQNEQLSKKIQVSYVQIQRLNKKLSQIENQKMLLQKQLAFQKNNKAINKSYEDQVNKLKYKIQDQQKRLQYQRKQKQTIKNQFIKKLQKMQNQYEHIKSLNQTLQKSYKEKLQTLQKRQQIQKTQFLFKIQQYQTIINTKLFTPKPSLQINHIQNINHRNYFQSTHQSSNQTIINIPITNLQNQRLINQYQEKISKLEIQLIEENKRLNILQQSNHELRRQLMIELQKEQKVRKMLVEQRKRSKSKQYFLEKEKTLKITDKYLNKSRSKDFKLQTSRSKFIQKQNNQKKEDPLAKIRKGIMGESIIQNKKKLEPEIISKKSNSTNNAGSSKRYANVNEDQQVIINNTRIQNNNFKINQDEFQNNVNNSLQTLNFANKIQEVKLINRKKYQKSDNRTNNTTQIIDMIKTNNQEDVSYSKYRISSQSLEEQDFNNANITHNKIKNKSKLK